jgi:hypothetical protein
MADTDDHREERNRSPDPHHHHDDHNGDHQGGGGGGGVSTGEDVKLYVGNLDYGALNAGVCTCEILPFADASCCLVYVQRRTISVYEKSLVSLVR